MCPAWAWWIMGRFLGIVTTRDLTNKVLAWGMDPDAGPGDDPDPVSLLPEALGSDILHIMLERRIGHLPVVAMASLWA
jgi:CBS domain-containing protein